LDRARMIRVSLANRAIFVYGEQPHLDTPLFAVSI
jgi:hypothetical protein